MFRAFNQDKGSQSPNQGNQSTRANALDNAPNQANTNAPHQANIAPKPLNTLASQLGNEVEEAEEAESAAVAVNTNPPAMAARAEPHPAPENPAAPDNFAAALATTIKIYHIKNMPHVDTTTYFKWHHRVRDLNAEEERSNQWLSRFFDFEKYRHNCHPWYFTVENGYLKNALVITPPEELTSNGVRYEFGRKLVEFLMDVYDCKHSAKLKFIVLKPDFDDATEQGDTLNIEFMRKNTYRKHATQQTALVVPPDSPVGTVVIYGNLVGTIFTQMLIYIQNHRDEIEFAGSTMPLDQPPLARAVNNNPASRKRNATSRNREYLERSQSLRVMQNVNQARVDNPLLDDEDRLPQIDYPLSPVSFDNATHIPLSTRANHPVQSESSNNRTATESAGIYASLQSSLYLPMNQIPANAQSIVPSAQNTLCIPRELSPQNSFATAFPSISHYFGIPASTLQHSPTMQPLPTLATHAPLNWAPLMSQFPTSINSQFIPNSFTSSFASVFLQVPGVVPNAYAPQPVPLFADHNSRINTPVGMQPMTSSGTPSMHPSGFFTRPPNPENNSTNAPTISGSDKNRELTK